MNVENGEKYRIVIESVEKGNLDALRTIAEICYVDMEKAKEIVNKVPVALRIDKETDLDVLMKKLSSNGIVANFKIGNEPIGQQFSETEKECSNETRIETSEKEVEKSVFKKFFDVCKIIIGIVCLCVFILCLYVSKFGRVDIIAMDLMAYVNGNDVDNPYLEMVLNHRPLNDGETYYTAFSRTFDANNWSYFKADNGQRIVQVVSTYNDISDDKMITQIAVTPTEEKGQFLIEPYAMRVSGKDLAEYEMNIVLAGVFKNDFAKALGELFLYSSLF